MNNTHARKLVCVNALRPAEEVSLDQRKHGETNIHEDGTGLEGLYPVAAAVAFSSEFNIFIQVP
jgi:hypothetical protein